MTAPLLALSLARGNGAVRIEPGAHGASAYVDVRLWERKRGTWRATLAGVTFRPHELRVVASTLLALARAHEATTGESDEPLDARTLRARLDVLTHVRTLPPAPQPRRRKR